MLFIQQQQKKLIMLLKCLHCCLIQTRLASQFNFKRLYAISGVKDDRQFYGLCLTFSCLLLDICQRGQSDCRDDSHPHPTPPQHQPPVSGPAREPGGCHSRKDCLSSPPGPGRLQAAGRLWPALAPVQNRTKPKQRRMTQGLYLRPARPDTCTLWASSRPATAAGEPDH